MSRFIQLPVIISGNSVPEEETSFFAKRSNISDPNYLKQLDKFVKSLKKEGLFEKFYAIYIYPFIDAGYRGFNLIDVEKYQLGFGASVEHVSKGIIPHTSGITTGITFANLENFATDMSFLHYSTYNGDINFNTVEAVSTSGGYNFTIYANVTNRQYRFDIVNVGNIWAINDVIHTGLVGVNSKDMMRTIYKNGAIVDSTSTISGAVNGSLLINWNDTTRNNLKAYQMHLLGKGLTDTQHAVLYDLVNTFLSAIEAI